MKLWIKAWKAAQVRIRQGVSKVWLFFDQQEFDIKKSMTYRASPSIRHIHA